MTNKKGDFIENKGKFYFKGDDGFDELALKQREYMAENIIKFRDIKSDNYFSFWTSESATEPVIKITDKHCYIRGKIIADNGVLYKEMLEFFKNNNLVQK